MPILRTTKRLLRVERLERRDMLAADILISEFLASNSGGLQDGDGDSSDWIELYNTTSSPIDLSGYYLTDDAGQLDKWEFPSGTMIEGNSTLLVFASDKADAPPLGELHTNFRLSADGEFLGLVDPDGNSIVHSFSPGFPPQTTNVSYGVSMTAASTTLVDNTTAMRYLVPTSGAHDATWFGLGYNDSSWTVATAGLGYESSPGSSPNFTALIDAAVPAGTTSAYARFQFHVSDASAITSLSLGMIYDDGFVAYLNGQLIAQANAPVSPAWNSTSDSILRPDDEILSDYVSYDVSSFVNLLVDGNNVLAIHALNLPDSSDMLVIPRLTGIAASVDEPLQFGFFDTPTPNVPNGQVFVGIVADTHFSVDRGFYTVPFTVQITSDTANALIVYTTDGSAPMVDENLSIVNGSMYLGPLSITKTTTLRAAAFKEGFVPTNVDTQTYVFVDDVIQQTHASTLAAGFPSSWGSRIADYGLDPDVIGPNDLFGGVYAAQIRDSLLAIPTISIVLDNDDFFGPGGIYSNPTGEGVLWERPASAELLYPDGTEGFQIDAGLRIAGAASRVLSRKNGLRLLFKSEYGDSKLEFPLFGDGVEQFDTVVLRPHFNDGWGWDGALGDPLFARDQWFRNTQIAMGHLSPRGNLAHLYVNGLYWGLYNPSERPDDSYNAEHLGGDKSEYDVMVADGVHDGSADAYNTMLSLAQSVVSAAGVTAKNAAYQLLQGNMPTGADDPAADNYLDVINYVDYMVLNHYGGNDDWPNRNWYAARRRGPESDGFKYYAWDSEISLDLSDRTSLTEDYTGQSAGAAQAYSILRNYEEFRLQFADRIHYHLFNGGALYVNPDSPTYDPAHPENNLPAARFADIANQVGEAIVGESARWGDQHVSFPRTKNIDWQNSLNYVLGPYFAQRHGIVLDQWRAAGLYPGIDAPEFVINGSRQHGNTIDAGDLLSFENSNSAPAGTIYYTTDGSDPRLVGGGINTATATQYSGPLTLDDTTRVRARILNGTTWSAIVDATFTVIPQPVELPGDYDGSLTVDQGDYVVWKSAFGTTVDPGTSADGNGDGVIDAADYTVWRDNLGRTLLPTPDFSFTHMGQTYAQDFSTFQGTEATLPPHFSVAVVGGTDIYRGVFDSITATPGSFTGIMAATSDGNDYSFAWREITGAAGLDDTRVLFTFTNNTDEAITGFEVSYDVEAWVNGRRDNQLRFKYDLYADSVASQAAEGRNAFETDIFATVNPNHTPIAANGDQFVLGGKDPANRETVSGYVDLTTLLVHEGNAGLGVFGPLPPGQTAYFRWQISNAVLTDGNRSALAFDNLRLTAMATAPASAALVMPIAAPLEDKWGTTLAQLATRSAAVEMALAEWHNDLLQRESLVRETTPRSTVFARLSDDLLLLAMDRRQPATSDFDQDWSEVQGRDHWRARELPGEFASCSIARLLDCWESVCANRYA